MLLLEELPAEFWPITLFIVFDHSIFVFSDIWYLSKIALLISETIFFSIEFTLFAEYLTSTEILDDGSDQ